ncbi:multiple sugar transport system permease protein [Lachnotalea glycerini]|uniref:Carbohydrate ABC transporter permease n=1 Tax=Lachnotalea glycerini TaxID=1763509 RepID=A0A255I5S7_9FIRM|nr:carbohydrate ABC transporter permease [Lachnotalea glycerini]OYO84357.1 sugar ABC transporter permease [Lachnotalea glycerini]PXV91021.1 multiple sugar transport system permease protein [Lachnotalea glycerini]RDY30120.1 carbohydrate ABC transporter permease [Lachnotalea glycerini]
MAMERSKAVKSKAYYFATTIKYFFLTLIALLTIYPIIYVVFGSFKENKELVLGGINILPKSFIVSNYVEAWQRANFARYTLNSMILSIAVMLLTLVISTMAGYCFARKDFFMKEVIYGIFLVFMFINVGSVSLRPLFELAVKLKINSSLLPVILISTGMGQATYIFLVRGYMNAVPKELDEAATLDGCSFFQIYYKIMLPVLKPVMASIALLSFRGAWNEYILPLVFTMTNEKLRPLTVGVVALRKAGDGAAAWNIMFAGSTIAIMPILLVYIFASKHFMGGLTAGSVKG